MEEIVIRAVRREATLDSLDRSGALRRVVASAGNETATELLRQAPGTFFQQTTPGQSTPILRGLRGSQVLHVVDGMRLNNAIFRDAPNQYLALVPLAGLDAVEVLPGPAPALYGADALGGVVSLRSRMPVLGSGPAQLSGRLAAGWSSADLRRSLALGADLSARAAALTVGVSERRFGNRRVGGGERLAPTAYESRSAYLTGQVRLGADQRLEFSGQWLEQPATPRYDELVPGFGQAEPASELFLFAPNSRTLARVGYRWQHPAREERNLRIDLARQRIVDDRRTRDTGAAATTLEANGSTLDGLVLQYSDGFGDRGRFVSGLELYSDHVDSARRLLGDDGTQVAVTARFPDGARLRSAAAYVAPEWRFSDALSVTMGLRGSAYRIEIPETAAIDAIDLAVEELTGRLGLRWQLSPALALLGSYGHGFRPPNVFDLGTLGPRPGNRFNTVNADLGPETLDNVEAGLRYSRGAVAVTGWLFAADYADRIRSVDTGAVTPGGRDVVRSVNGGTSRYRGAELQLRWRLGDGTRLDAAVNAVRGEDDFAGDRTPADRVPPVNGRVRLLQSWRQLTGTFALSWAAAQDRLSDRDLLDPRIDPAGTAGWTRLDITFDWRPRPGLLLRMALGNLLDARYREHGSGLDAPGRHLALALDWSG
jgi:outer membrane receptor protein involved in Fe transport